ncbi:TetR family transcriptional regulator [Herbihabitans rhizosphaerae]|uniref:TetR family transcriptional regulator n=1 Tax=Herbihabitans rhizosphaerae TaxID=1872711 RepID=A0A4Q7L779_9PSEU|nr:TetR/AcrR family transcriptional regulator [Herbihabitans rhizosphaerae]RZS44740.1 TetR family transcriptional regulator [Herbihabitans rhizosphaerae]
MAPPTRTPRSTWIEEGLRALAGGGPDAVRVEPLAKTLGVTRGGFYWHFKDRQALLDAMLETWEQLGAQGVIERVEAGGGDARTKVRRTAELIFTGGMIPTDLAIRDWARRDPAVAERLRRVDNRRVAYLRTLFGQFCPDDAEVEGRCMLAFSLVIGNYYIAADHGGSTRDQVLATAIEYLVA